MRHHTGVNFEIAAATTDDVPALLGLIRELAHYEKLADQVHATEESLRRDLFGARQFAEVLLAFVSGKAVGYTLFFYSYSTFLAKPGIYLEDLYVQPAARGSGIGKALLRQVARVAIEGGCGRLEFAVLDWNQPSIEFYKRLGAAPLGDWTTYRLTEGGIAQLAAGMR
jgi:GNAT superfamily N-acetyltransferase